MTRAETKGAAFFDLDRTLIPGSSLFLLARGAYERDMFRVKDLLRFGWGQLMFRIAGERSRDMEMSRNSTLEFVAGRRKEELMSWGNQIAEERILPRVYEDAVRVINEHRARGDMSFLVTAAPIELAGTIATALGMTGAIATESEIDDQGFYTGRLSGTVMHGPEKAKAVAEVAAEHGLALGDCSAYSDSMNDLPLLESVGDPHAVNPERELKRIAKVRGWPIHELRTRRRLLLVGIPAGLGGATLFLTGVGLGLAAERRRAASRRGAFARAADRFRR